MTSVAYPTTWRMMRLLLFLTAAAAAATILAAPSPAALPDSARVLMAHRSTITPSRQLALAKRTTKHARDVLGFLKHNPMYGTPRSRMRVQHDHLWLLRFGLAEEARARARIVAASWPAHHLLWLCIHGTPSLGTEVGHEASRWDTRAANGHYGGLQMHRKWGYGTSEYASDDSQLVQEQAAERGYRASGYSRSFLYGQWGETIGPCWKYA